MDGFNLLDEMFLQQWVFALSTSKPDASSWEEMGLVAQAFIGEQLYLESGMQCTYPLGTFNIAFCRGGMVGDEWV